MKLYSSEMWTMNRGDKKHREAFEMWCTDEWQKVYKLVTKPSCIEKVLNNWVWENITEQIILTLNAPSYFLIMVYRILSFFVFFLNTEKFVFSLVYLKLLFSWYLNNSIWVCYVWMDRCLEDHACCTKISSLWPNWWVHLAYFTENMNK